MSMTMEAAAKGGMTFCKFFPSDWRTGCLSLDLEEEGLYIRVCMYHYDTGKALPDDYPKCAMLLRVNLNKFTKVMNSLIAKDKIIRGQGILFNDRVQEEIDKYRAEYAARSAAAKKREEARRQRTLEQIEEAKRRAAAEVTPPVTPQVTPTLTPPVDGGVPTPVAWVANSKKPNEINIGGAQSWHGSTTNPETRIQKPEIIPLPPEQDAAWGGGHLESLNGTANDLVAFISKHAHVTPSDARRMLETNVKTFNADAMMEAYSVTLANMGSQFISAPYKYLIETARRIKTSGRTAQAGRANAASEMAAKRERIRKHAEEAAEAFERQRGRQ